jgi:hypothetical protein
MIRNLIGQRFGRLVVLKRGEKKESQKSRNAVWHCICDCGNEVDVLSCSLISGHTTSCGCYQKEQVANSHYKHGDGKHGKNKKQSRLYKIWVSMKSRCENKNSDAFKWYGAKGVSVCKEWHDYSIFKDWAIKNGYDETAVKWKCTLDRINPYGNYEPNNCRWVDMATQNKNRRIDAEMSEVEE